MENSLSFKNFRKFQNFPQSDFDDFTFLVGKNNSGKSTFVKALLLVANYIKSSDADRGKYDELKQKIQSLSDYIKTKCIQA